MKTKLTSEEYEEIENLMNYALVAPNKKEAEIYIAKIRAFGFGLQGNVCNILSELVGYIEAASGRVKDNSHWEDCAKSSLYKLHSYGVERN